MLFIISPSKTLDEKHQTKLTTHTIPDCLTHSQQLIELLKKKSPSDIAHLMKISDKLAQLNVARYSAWHQPFTLTNSKQALLTFKGDVYSGICAETLNESKIKYMQHHLRILSGLYGVLKPLDLIQPYRLEMGTKLNNNSGNNLYDFWQNHITQIINQEIKKNHHTVLINLASQEYFKVIQPQQIIVPIITPVFQDWKNGQYKIISFYAKKARGLMCRFAADQQLTTADQLKQFNYEDYRFNEAMSSDTTWFFTRKLS